jgi:toxin ParE1/3/4
MTPLIRRQLADEDVRQAIDFYLSQEGLDVASSFIDDLEQAYGHIQRHPATGSSRYAHELNLPGLRFWSLKRFSYLVFYMEGPEVIDVWRVLHSRRDIPAWLQTEV